MLVAQISLTLSRHFSLSFIASGRSSGQHPVSSHSCWMYVRAGRPAFARPCVEVHNNTSLMSSSQLLQQCPSCLVRLTWIVFVIGGRWPYSWCLVGCCCQDLFKIARSFELTKKRSRRYPAKTITDADYTDDIAILANTPNQAETLLHSLERAAAGIGLCVNAHKTEYIYYNQTGDISTLDGTPLKLVDKFTYLGSSVASTEKDIDTRSTKAWTAINSLSIIWKSDLTDKMKRSFFQAVVASILLYGCTTWTLTKRLEKKLDVNYRRKFALIPLRNVWTSLSLSYELNSTTTVLLQRWLWNQITHEGRHTIEQRNQIIVCCLVGWGYIKYTDCFSAEE